MGLRASKATEASLPPDEVAQIIRRYQPYGKSPKDVKEVIARVTGIHLKRYAH